MLIIVSSHNCKHDQELFGLVAKLNNEPCPLFSGSLCPLCEDECDRPCLALGVHEQQRNMDEEAELKRDQKTSSVNEEKKEDGCEKAETVAKGHVEMAAEYNQEKDPEFQIGESKAEILEGNKNKCDVGIRHDVSSDLVPSTQEEKRILQMNASSPVNLVMVCEESAENSVNEEHLLCPAQSLTLSQTSLISSPPSHNPLTLTLPPDNPSVLHLQTQPVVQTQGSVPQAPCLTKRAHESNPSVEPKTLAHSGKVEVTLQQVYTTRRYTRFTSRSAPLKSVHLETTSQPLPCMSDTTLLAPAPKKKTRTSYSTGE